MFSVSAKKNKEKWDFKEAKYECQKQVKVIIFTTFAWGRNSVIKKGESKYDDNGQQKVYPENALGENKQPLLADCNQHLFWLSASCRREENTISLTAEAVSGLARITRESEVE